MFYVVFGTLAVILLAMMAYMFVVLAKSCWTFFRRCANQHRLVAWEAKQGIVSLVYWYDYNRAVKSFVKGPKLDKQGRFRFQRFKVVGPSLVVTKQELSALMNLGKFDGYTVEHAEYFVDGEVLCGTLEKRVAQFLGHDYSNLCDMIWRLEN